MTKVIINNTVNLVSAAQYNSVTVSLTFKRQLLLQQIWRYGTGRVNDTSEAKDEKESGSLSI